jgi:nucleotide-binding universal stress UspA family protein
VIRGDDVSAALQQVVNAAPEPVICMTTHGRGRVGGAIIGSTAEQLLRGVEAPFLLVGPHCDGDWSIESNRLLACLDESPTSNAVLHPASELCRALGLELWLAEVFPPLDAASTLSAWRYTDHVAEHVRADLPLVRTVSGWSRHPADEILHLRASVSACMIAMGTHGRSGLARVALGSVTMAVVHRAPCPVFTIRPPGLA